MEKFQAENLSYHLIKSLSPSKNFDFPSLIDANNYWNDYSYVKGSSLKYGYLAIGKQFHASISIKQNFQSKNHKRRKVNRQCTNAQMGTY